MQRQPLVASQRDRIAAGLPFVESLARRVAVSMPHSIELGDLVQDGMLGLIDAAYRFDEARGIKFETFAERRVRGAMIDALRRDAWPRGVRRQRRELEAEREVIALSYYGEATMKQIGAEIGVNESRVSQLHARAIQRLRKALGADCSAAEAARLLRPAILSFQRSMQRLRMAKVSALRETPRTAAPAVVLRYKAPAAPRGRRRAIGSHARAIAR